MNIQYELTLHAHNMIRQRSIKLEWIDYAMNNPQYIEHYQKMDKLYYYAKIEEFKNRYLKIVLSIKTKPYKIVTVHFDRRIRKKYETNN